ncbi:MAG: flavin reductase family protein [Bryobacter sp.]|jgi:flavin reductase (DIM6/NTAB) family NADH-FMN oxidoreductase RutF|nr:flavin reductase family protein [Bryobacter sp. CoA8 C33]
MIICPEELSARELYKLLIGTVVPRPIAWVSTISRDGVRNLAPYSFFNAVSADPPVVCFAPSRKPAGDPRKDTLRNVEETGEFVVNIVSVVLAEAMNRTAAEVGPEVDEFELAGVTAVAATRVSAPMVAEAPAKLECRLKQILPMGDRPTSGILVLGEVVCFHYAEGMVEEYRVDAGKLDAVGRMGGMSYSCTRERFDLIRP